MSYDSFYITKRDGSREKFSLEKIKGAILKASLRKANAKNVNS